MPSGDVDSVRGGWYVVGPDQQRYGPYDLAKLRCYVADGRLTPQSLVCQRGMSEWVAASTIPGLFGMVTREVNRPTPSGEEVERPTRSAGAGPTIQCSTCKQGILTRQRLYRLSTPVVVIGYILLVPSILGIALTVIVHGFLILMSLGSSAAGVADQDPKIAASNSVLTAISVLSAAFFVVMFFVAGLIGWLLVMRRTVLKCGHCGIALDAS
jgi:hypothetical protein